MDTETLSAHFARIIENEGGKITATALHLIARAADGSVRDGLSLLDQAISQADGEISEGEVRAMLGLADRTQTFDLLETILGGEVADALEQFDRQYRDGSDPMAILEDMLEIVHWLTRIKVVPEAVHDSDVPEMERNRGMDMEARLKMPVLARAWQMLLKGLQEVRFAPSARQAAEMLLIRLAYTAMLPTPDDALKSWDRLKAPNRQRQHHPAFNARALKMLRHLPWSPCPTHCLKRCRRRYRTILCRRRPVTVMMILWLWRVRRGKWS